MSGESNVDCLDYTGVIFTLNGVDTDLNLLVKHTDKYYMFNIFNGRMQDTGEVGSVDFIHEMFQSKIWKSVGHLDDFLDVVVEVIREQGGD